jgi:heat shock protein HslJ
MTIIEAMIAAMFTLTGSHWVSANNAHQSVEFKTSQIMGNAGCNQFFGTYKQKDSKITVNPLATTRKACEHDVMLREHDFLLMLESAKHVDIEADMLVLKNGAGDILAKFNRKEVG